MMPRQARSQDDDQSGSSLPGEPEFLVVGKLGKPHGVDGEIVMAVYTDFPERLQEGAVVFIGKQYKPLQITRRRLHASGLLLGFAGYQTRENVAELTNLLVQVRTSGLPELEQGEFYQHQLIGLHVVDERGEMLGRITGIIETGANDVFIVQDEDENEILIPAIDSVVNNIDLGANQIRIRLLPGLIP